MAFTRRTLLVSGAVAGAAAGVSGCFHRRSSSWEFLTEAEARTLAPLCDQIIPADDFPSASEAGVLLYIDRQLIRHYHKHQQAYRDGLAEVERLSHNRFGADYATLPSVQKLDVLQAVNHEFFELLRQHTMEGYYGSPRHGGNRDTASWHMLGIDAPPLRGRAQYHFNTGKQS